jgi:hypothetical protein
MPSEVQSHPVSSGQSFPEHNGEQDDMIDLREIILRIFRGLPQTLGLALLGLAITATAYFTASPSLSVSTTSRVVFSFPGYERGQYPDRSKFQPDDLRAPEIIVEALKRLKFDSSEKSQSDIRAALTIEGIIPVNVIKERDRLRAAGQTPPQYLPDEYQLTLALPRNFPLTSRQREQLLNEIVNAYRDKFQRTYSELPSGFGSAFETLKNADFFEYELVLNQEVQNIFAYLNQQVDAAKSFRSQKTNFSFSDLLMQAQLFSQIRLNETLGLIRQNGLSKNRKSAMVKMDYYLRLLEDQESKAIAEEKVVQDLLAKAQDREQNYVLGVKSQVAQSRPEAPILDQGLLNSLLANDAYNFLVRRALDAGLNVKRIQAEKAVLLERRKAMETFLQGDVPDQASVIAEVQRSLADLENSYKELVSNIRRTSEDYQRQQFADAVRISMQAVTGGFYRKLAMAGIAGLGIGGALGLGLSLLGFFVGAKKPR